MTARVYPSARSGVAPLRSAAILIPAPAFAGFPFPDAPLKHRAGRWPGNPAPFLQEAVHDA